MTMIWPNLSNPNRNHPPNGPTAGILGPDLVLTLLLSFPPFLVRHPALARFFIYGFYCIKVGDFACRGTSLSASSALPSRRRWSKSRRRRGGRTPARRRSSRIRGASGKTCNLLLSCFYLHLMFIMYTKCSTCWESKQFECPQFQSL